MDSLQTAPGTSVVERVRANQRLAQEDLRAALKDAESIVEAFGPHPLALARLALVQGEIGDPAARETARHCAELARSVGNFGVLADLWAGFRSGLDFLDLDVHEQIRMAQSLAARERDVVAIELYRQILREHRDYVPAVKGLLQIAEKRERRTDTLEAALEVYDLLQLESPGHPFADFVEQAREEIVRQLERRG